MYTKIKKREKTVRAGREKPGGRVFIRNFKEFARMEKLSSKRVESWRRKTGRKSPYREKLKLPSILRKRKKRSQGNVQSKLVLVKCRMIRSGQ